MTGLVIDLFAGPGGWSEGLRALGLDEVGLEWDDAACRTARAAGHTRVRADVARFPLDRLYRLWLLIGSPPCRMFSAAGSGAGKLVMDELASAIVDALAGRHTIAAHRRRMVRVLQAAALTTSLGKLPRAERSARIWAQVMDAALVVQPARFIAATRPEYVALEQVPAVRPLWNVYAHELRKMGYDVRVELLHAEQYGVPQTRTRVILAASRVGPARLPQPTHARYRKGEPRDGEGTLFGLLPPVTMAESLGWGATERPLPTLTAGGGLAGGVEPIARGGRAALELEQERGAWVVDRRTNSKGAGGAMVPTVTRPCDGPAPTLTGKSGMQWVLRQNARENATVRGADEPAPTITAAHDRNERQWVLRHSFGVSSPDSWTDHLVPLDEPAPTVDTKARAWVLERPATTIVGSFGADIVAAPGYRTDVSRQNADGGVRVSIEEAAVLQGFRRDYPWAGSRSKQFEQVGNAVPPPLACAVVGALLGRDWRAALDAARERAE